MNGFVKGSGYYVPKLIIHNNDFQEIIDTNDEWIKTRTGINTRHFSNDETSLEIAYKASINAIEDSKIDKEEIDLIIVATITGDNITPSTACMLQEKLGLNNSKIMAFDLNAACSGFVYALHVGSSLIDSNNFKCGLIVGVDLLSKILDFSDRSTSVLFGDGAGAFIIKKDQTSKYFYSRSKGDSNSLYCKGLSIREKFGNQNNENLFLKMNGQEVFRFAVESLNDVIDNLLSLSNDNEEDIDLIIPHQANLRIINNVIKSRNLDLNKFYLNLDKYGNTSAASIAIAFAEAKEKNIIHKNMKIMLIGFGAGLTWAGAYFKV